MATLMRDGFAARLGVIKFDQRFGFWLRDFGFRITAFVSSSVAARLSEDSFHFYMVELYEGLGIANLCNFICCGVACRVANPNGFSG